jgi:hypothetical protein
MTAAAISAAFADWRPVKSRSVLQLVLEVPIEQTERVMSALGAPMPGKEKWVAVALLADNPAKSAIADKADEGTRRAFSDLRPSQQAGILCNDPAFQKWVGAENSTSAALALRHILGIKSRSELDINDAALGEAWRGTLRQFQESSGRMAEMRG